MQEAQVYSVGWLSTIQATVRALTLSGLKGRRLANVRRVWRIEHRHLVRRVKARDWRAVRNSFNGYLCEHDAHPHSCGTGWTKRAAIRRADRICVEARDNTLAEWWPAA